jgi:hypothetical protein
MEPEALLGTSPAQTQRECMLGAPRGMGTDQRRFCKFLGENEAPRSQSEMQARAPRSVFQMLGGVQC